MDSSDIDDRKSSDTLGSNDSSVTILLEKHRNFPLRRRETSQWAKHSLKILFAMAVVILSLPPAILLLQSGVAARVRSKNESVPAVKPYINYRNIRPPNPSQWLGLDCGNSKAEALTKGCVWEPRESGWISSRCINPEGIKYWDELEVADGELDWTWDKQGLQKIPNEDFYSVDGPLSDITPDQQPTTVYFSWMHHYWHCDYSLRMLAMGLSKATAAMPEKTFSEEHASHCLDVLAGRDVQPLSTRIGGHLAFRNCFVELSPRDL